LEAACEARGKKLDNWHEHLLETDEKAVDFRLRARRLRREFDESLKTIATLEDRLDKAEEELAASRVMVSGGGGCLSGSQTDCPTFAY
jgi:uncharacterized coiled-coil DUF342 family protein